MASESLLTLRATGMKVISSILLSTVKACSTSKTETFTKVTSARENSMALDSSFGITGNIIKEISAKVYEMVTGCGRAAVV